MTKPLKFAQYHPDQNKYTPHDYQNRFFQEPDGAFQRLVIGPTSNQVDLLPELLGDVDQSQLYLLTSS